jgi:hypothetical protein
MQTMKTLRDFRAVNDTQEINRTLMTYLGRFQDKFPHELAAKHPHIVAKIVKLWYSPEVNAYFTEVVFDAYGIRKEFTLVLTREIFSLWDAYDRIFQEPNFRSPSLKVASQGPRTRRNAERRVVHDWSRADSPSH